uniref:Uncharacterized protein n=1 Tax=Alexandrium andersonii TaxID=327968 RepID=A0A7S2MF90_9DINO
MMLASSKAVPRLPLWNPEAAAPPGGPPTERGGPPRSAAAELAEDVQRADEGHEDERQDQHSRGSNLQARGIVRVEVEDATASCLPSTVRGHGAAAAAGAAPREGRALTAHGGGSSAASGRRRGARRLGHPAREGLVLGCSQVRGPA